MHTLDPAVFDPAAIPDEIHALNASIVALMTPMPEWWDVGADVFRASRKAGNGVFPAPVLSPRARDQVIDGPGGPLTLRILPPVGASRGVYLHIHGGGWVLGAADEQDRLLEITADTTGLTAISVDYRLAPEHPFPAGPDDCEAAALWALEHLADFGGDRFAIGGESAGAHLASLTLLRLRDRHGGARCHAANLTFGAFDIAQTPSARAADVVAIRRRISPHALPLSPRGLRLGDVERGNTLPRQFR
jgi:acetyl esterase/lipase